MNPDALVDAHAVTTLWSDLRPSTIRTWEARAKITAYGRDRQGRKLYRVADVIALVERRDTWNQRRTANHTGVM